MTVSSATNRVSYNGNGSTTVFAYTFKIFDQDDLTVIIRSANGTETVKTITTHYTVSGVGNAGGGNVTMLTAPASGETLVVIREQDLIQELDIVPNDPFPAESVETALDKLTFIVQQHGEELSRAIKASRTNTIGSTEFTISAANRANKIFAFDSSGELAVTQEIGTYRGNWASGTAFAQRDLVKDTSNDNIYICLTAHTSTGSQPISSNADVAKWALIVDAAAATTSASAAASSASAAATSETNAANSASAASTSETNAASSASSASTSATNSSNSATASAASAASAAASYDSFDDRYLGAKASNPTLDNDGNALIDGALYFDTTNNVMKVYDLGTTTWLRTTPSSGDQANINTVTGIAADITTVAGISGDVATVAGISADVTAVVADEVDIGIVAADLTGSNTVGTVAGIAANVTTVAGISADVTTAADNIAAIIAAPAEAAAAAASEANALAHRNDAQSAATQAQAARDTANLHKLAAEAAATSATNTAAALTGFDLDAIAASKAVTAVDVFVYDTSRDSDGGAWRKRTQYTSWYNETLNTATRGARREFPAVAVIVAEAAKVTIYDGDDPSLPMWMVFTNAGAGRLVVGNISSVFMLNGWMSYGETSFDIKIIDFLGDRAERLGVGITGKVWPEPISGRNTSTTFVADAWHGADIINRTINDVAMTVLPDAPIDPATGLQVPTIAVATAGGVSVIKDDGTVVDSASTVVTSVSIDQEKLSYVRVDECRVIALANIVSDGFTYDRRYNTGPTISASFLPQPLSGSNKPLISDTVSFAASSGLTRLYEDTSSQTKGMVAYTTSTYNTGWMNGNIKGAFLSSTDATSLVGSGELVTNGTFDTDTSGWTAGNSATIAATSGVAQVTQTSSNLADIRQTLTTVAGRIYRVSCEVASQNGASIVAVAQDTSTFSVIQQSAAVTSASLTTVSFVFTANAATTRILVRFNASGASGNTFTTDNISVQLADADRSVNNKGLIVNGTVTRSAVATGANLVAYSGFSASNYLEQPYNSALDFGTGDFSVMAWVKTSSAGTDYIIHRATTGQTSDVGFFAYIDLSGYLAFATRDAGTSTVTGTQSIATNTWRNFCFVRRSSGTIQEIYLDGSLHASATVTARNITGIDESLFVGIRADGGQVFDGSLALLRISATAPTAEQIRKIYEDEKVLFQANAACTLYGTSDAVTALAHDPDTGLLHVGTSAGRSVFQGLRRVANTTTAVGTAISASNGLVVDE